jgi:hypothetical protein
VGPKTMQLLKAMRGQPGDGAVLGLILLGLSPIFWYGFALPLGPLLGIAQLVLLMLVWRSLSL